MMIIDDNLSFIHMFVKNSLFKDSILNRHKSVYDRLSEILGHCLVSERWKVDAVKTLLIPEIGFLKLFHIKGFICEWSNV